ncbi:MAG: magnesium transporter, partial [Alphaproteobacteria bacterium]|nr:magnesium transporter [Alphaproteobacteria bacterium]
MTTAKRVKGRAEKPRLKKTTSLLGEAMKEETLAMHLEKIHQHKEDSIAYRESGSWHQLVRSLKEELHSYPTSEQRIIDLVKPLSPPEVAEIIHLLNNRQRLRFMQAMINTLQPEVITKIDDDILQKLLPKLPARFWKSMLKKLESDDALDLIELFDEKQQQRLLEFIPRKDRAEYTYVLNLPDDTAGKLMRRELVTAPKFWTVGQIIDYLRDKKIKTPDMFYNIIIVGESHRPVGLLPLSRLLRASRPTPLARLMDKEFQEIAIDMNQEDVARLFARYSLTEAPVIDHLHRLVGSITVDDVVEVIQEEHEEDILLLGGVKEGDFYKTIVPTTWFRFGWLFINLMTAIAASAFINLYQATIQELVALAVLMPIVPSMGGNAGTQTTTVVVRALATGDLVKSNTIKIILKEISVGLLNGVLFAVIIGYISYLWAGNWLMGIAMASAIVITLLAAGFAGVVIPLVLKKLKYDPA